MDNDDHLDPFRGQGAKPVRMVISGALDAPIHHTPGGVVNTGALDARNHHAVVGVVNTGALSARNHHRGRP
ncbi:hypothetical protein [Actinoplanes sp. NBRC 101535]|uniref:hypothetical protein n=1 Tax=Actinoplanes sp. NBRC 101535 TaxID=3032196 RepID=UPI002557BADC|nr:hypothetical protein [Actinoplanes sp. NBRC 101535]